MAKNKKTKISTAKKGGFAQAIKNTPLALLCYLAVVCLWLLACSFCLVQDTLLRSGGSLKTQSLQAEDFTMNEMQLQKDGSYKTTSDDPQMHLAISGGIRTLRFYASYTNASNPLEICLYYTRSQTAAFSNTMRVWPILQGDGSRLFVLPRGNIAKIRLDAASALTHITFGKIIINEAQPPAFYYNPGWGNFVAFLVLPGLFAAALAWVLPLIKRFWPAGTKPQPGNPRHKRPIKKF